MVECLFTNLVVVGSSPVAVVQTSDIVAVSSKEYFDIQEEIECGLTRKCVRDMMIT